MTVIPHPGTEPGTPFTDAMQMVGAWPVPQIGTRVFDLARCAAAGVPSDQLALGFEIAERDAVTLACHYGIGCRRGARHLEPLSRVLKSGPPARHPVQPSFLELSQPREVE